MGSKGVARQSDGTTGHGPYAPRTTKGAGVGGSSTVFADNLGVNRVDDQWNAHGSSPRYTGDPHPGDSSGDNKTITGSSTVFANNKAVARIGDQVDTTIGGDKIAGGSGTVFAG
jgi:uncharacterized Zn-binding protein involved in type VI secretion